MSGDGSDVTVLPMPSLEGYEIASIEDLGDDGDMVIIHLGEFAMAWATPGSAESWARVLNASAARIRELIVARDAADEGGRSDG